MTLHDRMLGCLLGGALGDAMGGPFEGQTGPLEYVEPKQWYISDDTQLTLATCESIITGQTVSPEHIANTFRRWFCERRISGVGSSTLKALTELAAGGHWALVGAKGDKAAGNGAALRAAVLAFFLNPHDSLDRRTLRDACRITHHHEEAYVGALAIVYAVHSVASGEPACNLCQRVASLLPDSVTRDRLQEIANQKQTIQEIGAIYGSSGYVVDTVCLALFAASRAADNSVMNLLEEIVEIGGDTDSNAALTGQLLGAFLGVGAIPSEFRAKMNFLKLEPTYLSDLVAASIW